uniref:Uncharacterized protein n=1 Tax=Acrobeloides nanus TaxID=290746 RepID=A0A914C0C4_9BILA
MEIEVKQSDGAFVKAYVKAIMPAFIEVTYEGEWKPDEKVEYENCRLPKVTNKKSNFKAGDEIEACLKQTNSEVHQWKKAKIRDIKGTFAVVETLTEPIQVEIVSYDCCRPADSTTPLSFDKLQQFPIKADPELYEYFKIPDSFKDLIDAVGNIHVEFNETEGNIIVWSYADQAIRRVKVLKDFFINDSKRKLSLLHRQEEANKITSDVLPKHIEEFTVATDLTGLVIGKRGSNLGKARAIDGIKGIELDETRSKTHCYIKIYADTLESIEQARGLLEFISGKVKVPRTLADLFLCLFLKEIVDKSGVLRVNIADPEATSEESDSVEFVFTGTKETVSLAELLVNYQLKHNRELDELREELERKLPPKPSPVRRRGSFGRGGEGSRRTISNTDDFQKRDRNSQTDRSRGTFRGGRGRRFDSRRYEGQSGPRRDLDSKRKDSVHSEKSTGSEGSAKKITGGARRRRFGSQGSAQ